MSKGNKPSPVLCQRKKEPEQGIMTRLLRRLSTAWGLVSHQQAVIKGGSGDKTCPRFFLPIRLPCRTSVGSGKGDKPSPVLCQRKRNLNKEFLTGLLRVLVSQTGCELEASGEKMCPTFLFADRPSHVELQLALERATSLHHFFCQRKRNLNKEFLTRLLRSTAWVLVPRQQMVS